MPSFYPTHFKTLSYIYLSEKKQPDISVERAQESIATQKGACLIIFHDKIPVYKL